MSAARAWRVAAALAALCGAAAVSQAAPDGAGIMDRVRAHRPQACCIYQELTMILSDAAGERGVRRFRSFERREPDGSSRLLLVFVAPADVRGAAVLATRDASGVAHGEVYLPALGRPLDLVAGTASAMPVVGSDFRLGDLVSEAPRDFAYAREADAEIDRSMHYVVRATPLKAAVQRAGGGARRYYVRKGDYFLVRTDFHDLQGGLARRQSFRDPKEVEPGVWQAGMILMEDYGERHRTLIKVERRVFSPEYVPPDIFSRQWLLEERHLLVGGSPFGP
ncbi:MAG TPA: outer membrane lipoprotein-sorting protein [Burkholderiales bacterium]|nr:outer membrane lipoprotein-sorting protein [Burkholderiales bacterium]